MTTSLIEAISRAIAQDDVAGYERIDPGYTATVLLNADSMAGYRSLAEAALTAITEAGYEICPKGTMAALDASRVAIDDWLNTYAPDECNENRVKEARTRIFENGGTLAYIAQIQEHNRSISAAQGDGA